MEKNVLRYLNRKLLKIQLFKLSQVAEVGRNKTFLNYYLLFPKRANSLLPKQRYIPNIINLKFTFGKCTTSVEY